MSELTVDQVTDARGAKYNSPAKNFKLIADMASGAGFLFNDPKLGVRPLEAKDVPIFMIMVKLSREIYQHDPDNTLDTGGYAKTIDKLYEGTIV